MRKIAVIGIVLLTAAAFGCSKKSQENASDQMAPAPAAQQAAPAAPAPAPAQEAAPAAPTQGMQGMDMGKPESAPADNKATPQDGAKPN